MDSSKPLRILVADDDEIGSLLMKEMLTEFGAEVHAVFDGRAALTQAMIYTYDAIILDIEMPFLDGIAVCSKLRGMAFTREVPILMLTGMTDRESVERSFAAGAGDFLTKPIYPTLLWQRVCNLVELRTLKRNSENLMNLLEFSQADFRSSTTSGVLPLPTVARDSSVP